MVRFSFVVQSSCSCELYTEQVPHILLRSTPTVGWVCFLLWRSNPALVSLILLQGATRPNGQGRTLLFPILFVVQVPAQLSPSLPPGATLLK